MYQGPDFDDLEEDMDVELFLGNKTVAKCTLVHVAQNGRRPRNGEMIPSGRVSALCILMKSTMETYTPQDL